ncbi:hypothetical protein KC887_10515 [Candidatus Kaiserbacteria bacterium]|nr:hypothetical protein [Candidatus Kaiserbacteria bacterium]
MTTDRIVFVADMELRDHFAGLAMSSLLGNERAMNAIVLGGMTIQEFAYKTADQMVAERDNDRKT